MNRDREMGNWLYVEAAGSPQAKSQFLKERKQRGGSDVSIALSTGTL